MRLVTRLPIVQVPLYGNGLVGRDHGCGQRTRRHHVAVHAAQALLPHVQVVQPVRGAEIVHLLGW
jgi:hypothetical protein